MRGAADIAAASRPGAAAPSLVLPCAAPSLRAGALRSPAASPRRSLRSRLPLRYWLS